MPPSMNDDAPSPSATDCWALPDPEPEPGGPEPLSLPLPLEEPDELPDPDELPELDMDEPLDLPLPEPDPLPLEEPDPEPEPDPDPEADPDPVACVAGMSLWTHTPSARNTLSPGTCTATVVTRLPARAIVSTRSSLRSCRTR